MADINVQMPSENEDFDARAEDASSAPAATAEATPAPAVSETPDFSAPAPAADPAPAEEAAPAAAEPAPEVPAEPAPAAEAPAPVAAAPTSPKMKRSLPVWPIVSVVLLVLVLALGFMNMSLSNSKKDLQKKLDAAYADPQAIIQKQTDDLINKVGQLMKLPAGETPTVANVSDASKAKQQSAFFANAQNGDKVLMYVKAGEAILYRPSTNKIILVAPLTFNNTATGSTAK